MLHQRCFVMLSTVAPMAYRQEHSHCFAKLFVRFATSPHDGFWRSQANLRELYDSVFRFVEAWTCAVAMSVMMEPAR